MSSLLGLFSVFTFHLKPIPNLPFSPAGRFGAQVSPQSHPLPDICIIYDIFYETWLLIVILYIYIHIVI